MREVTSPTKRIIRLEDAEHRQVDPMSRASVITGVPSSRTSLALRDFLLVGGSLAFLAIIGMLYLLQAADITRIAYHVQDMQENVSRLQQENTTLIFEIAELERLDRIDRRAEEIGLQQPWEYRYVSLLSGDDPQEQVVDEQGVAESGGR